MSFIGHFGSRILQQTHLMGRLVGHGCGEFRLREQMMVGSENDKRMVVVGESTAVYRTMRGKGIT